MKQKFKHGAVALACVAAFALPSSAEDTPAADENPELSEGAELLSEGFRLLLEGLANEVEPLAEEWSKGWAELARKFGDMQVYYPPEVLPNGDIIIRRREPLVVEPPADGETDL
ncbi:hypothetical protein [Aliiroseovarius marinus]|uniref:hypothetical protein n=1 Tax=Aliiroseovarius marinus TaxID=2500159 RepID=UPI003D7CF870